MVDPQLLADEIDLVAEEPLAGRHQLIERRFGKSLGVAADANDNDLKKAYRKQAIKVYLTIVQGLGMRLITLLVSPGQKPFAGR